MAYAYIINIDIYNFINRRGVYLVHSSTMVREPSSSDYGLQSAHRSRQRGLLLSIRPAGRNILRKLSSNWALSLIKNICYVLIELLRMYTEELVAKLIHDLVFIAHNNKVS